MTKKKRPTKSIPELTDNDSMPFGQHKGKKMINVPADYFLYIYDMPWIKDWPRVEMYISKNFEILLAEQKKQRIAKPKIG